MLLGNNAQHVYIEHSAEHVYVPYADIGQQTGHVYIPYADIVLCRPWRLFRRWRETERDVCELYFDHTASFYKFTIKMYKFNNIHKYVFEICFDIVEANYCLYSIKFGK